MARGRKARNFIDVYRDVSVTAYEPNTIGAIGRVGLAYPASTETPFIQSIERLINLQCERVEASRLEVICMIRLRYVVADFLSRKFNMKPPFPLVDELGKPLKRSTLKYIKVLGAEATALFNLVSDVFAVRPIAGYSSAAELWAEMMIENLPAQDFFESNDFSELTKSKAVTDYRSKSAALTNRENPYRDGSAHGRFFQIALRCADAATGRAEDRFSIHARSFLPYLKERAAVAAYVHSKKSKVKLMKK